MMEGSCEDIANSNTIFSSLLFTFDHRTFRRHLNETKLNRHRVLRCQLPELLRCYFDTLLREVALKRALHRGRVDDQLAAVSATSLAPDLNFSVILTYYIVEHYR